jgi:hypothetical protein
MANRTAIVSVALAADNAVVAAVTGRRIRLLGYLIVSAGSVVATWKSATTALSGAMNMIVGVPQSIGPGSSMDAEPLMVCDTSEALNLTLGGAVQVSGFVIYDVID